MFYPGRKRRALGLLPLQLTGHIRERAAHGRVDAFC